MEEKVISMFEMKKEYGKNIRLTDELLDFLGQEYLEQKENTPHQMNFTQWIEYRMMSWM